MNLIFFTSQTLYTLQYQPVNVQKLHPFFRRLESDLSVILLITPKVCICPSHSTCSSIAQGPQNLQIIQFASVKYLLIQKVSLILFQSHRSLKFYTFFLFPPVSFVSAIQIGQFLLFCLQLHRFFPLISFSVDFYISVIVDFLFLKFPFDSSLQLLFPC